MMRFLLFLFLSVLLSVAPHLAQAQQQDDHPYQNPHLPIEKRAADLVSRMTLDEKVSQMKNEASAIKRLGIPEYNWWNEGLHGVARSGLATVFPQAIGLAATWNDRLIYRMAKTISDEARAKYQRYVRQNQHHRYQGLTIWSPNINLVRDPRWGRGQETYGEDPYLTSRIAIPFIRGLQGDDPKYLKTVATVKHFALYSGPEPKRHTFNAVPDERDFRETYLAQFRRTIRRAHPYSLMCSYNRVYGEPACSNARLLENILREQWSFNGYIVSDCWALNDIYAHHKVTQTAMGAAVRALKAGTDLDCGGEVYPKLTNAVRQGLVGEAAIDTAVTRLFRTRFKLGMFDSPAQVDYAQIPYEVVDAPAHRKLAREVARESMVLLKNEGAPDEGVLPLDKDLDTLAVIGPNADQWLMLLGNYHGVPGTLKTPLEGIRAAVSPQTTVLYAQGSEIADGFPVFEEVPAGVLSMPEGQPSLDVAYFDNRDLRGAPVATATDSILLANWRDQAPQNDLDPDDFGVLWTGTLTPRRSGTYRLGVIATSQFALYLNDSLLTRSRREQRIPHLVKTDSMHLDADETYSLRMEVQEGGGYAQAQLLWTRLERDDLLDKALNAAQQADAVVLCMGLTPALEGEERSMDLNGFRGGDRTTLTLPDVQQRLIRRVNATGTPTVLTLLNGSALATNWANEHVPGILEVWYPGQAAGTAMADVLFGDYNPAGRLPVTFYRSVDQLPPFTNYDMQGRTYRFFDGKPLYPFGYGLSYTTFAYHNLQTSSSTLSTGDTTIVRVDVTNTGKRSGDEVVQLYAEHPHSDVERPRKELEGFERITIAPGETKTVTLPLAARDLAYWDPDRDRWTVEDETVLLGVGRSSEDLRQTVSLDVAP